jgi:peptidoglycan hydrolase CwlO-like protein
MQADLQHLQEQLTDEQFKYSELELRANKAEGDVLELKNEAAKADRARRELEADVDRLKNDLERVRA